MVGRSFASFVGCFVCSCGRYRLMVWTRVCVCVLFACSCVSFEWQVQTPLLPAWDLRIVHIRVSFGICRWGKTYSTKVSLFSTHPHEFLTLAKRATPKYDQVLHVCRLIGCLIRSPKPQTFTPTSFLNGKGCQSSGLTTGLNNFYSLLEVIIVYWAPKPCSNY